MLRLSILCAVELALAVLLALALDENAAERPVAAGTKSASEPARETAPAAHLLPANSAAPPTVARDEQNADARNDASTTNETVRAVGSAKMRADDAVGVLLCGNVRWRDGSAVAEPRVWASAGKDNRSASTGKDGSFAMPRLAPGEWRLTVNADGAADLATTIVLDDSAVQQRDFVLDRSFPVRVLIVTRDGQDATRAMRTSLQVVGDFFVAGQKERFPDRLAPTDYGRVFVGDAKFDAERNPENGFAGTLSFVEPLPGHAALLLRHVVLDQQVVQPDQKEVRFVVDVEALKGRLGSATVRLVDEATGQPLAGVFVALNTSNSMGSGTKTDADGRAVAENLLPGLLQFSIRGKDHESLWQMVRVEPGQRLDLGEIRLGPKQNLKGRVVDADGKPTSARLSWAELKWRHTPTQFIHNRMAAVQADGTFELSGTGTGAIAVTARGDGGRLAIGVFDNPSAVPVELRLQPTVDCVITRPKDPSRSFVVTLYDGRHRAVAAMAIEPRTLEHSCSMPPGEYAFDVHDDAGVLQQSGTLTFGATPARLEIR